MPMSSGVAGARHGSGTAGVVGANGADGFGVYGASDSGVAIQGYSGSGAGIRGLSSSFVGLVGISDTSIGLYGYNVSPSVPAFYAENLGPNNRIAGYFNGDVQVNGNFTVLPGFNKNAAVAMPDGSDAVVYCQESPEPYFEDFGRAQLVNGVAQIDIEREFASIVRREDYMVFLTPGGDSKGLYVSRQNPQGFEVREAQGGKSSLPFTYRVVAQAQGHRRKAPCARPPGPQEQPRRDAREDGGQSMVLSSPDCAERHQARVSRWSPSRPTSAFAALDRNASQPAIATRRRWL